MKWLTRTCILIGLGLLGTSFPFPSAVEGQTYTDYYCNSSWQCSGTYNNCNVASGRVPNCGPLKMNTCTYNVPGYICLGLTFGNQPCMVNFIGCQ